MFTSLNTARDSLEPSGLMVSKRTQDLTSVLFWLFVVMYHRPVNKIRTLLSKILMRVCTKHNLPPFSHRLFATIIRSLKLSSG